MADLAELASKDRNVKYRADIDGLRAVAVLAVVCYHLGLHVYGGFIGVDVFFVISGYLISAVILAEFERGAFSLANFYERRIRRIFPALLVTLAWTFVLVCVYFTPRETKDFATSLIATLTSTSNLLFWSQAGYFDDPSLTKPLLHTWSLAVEEQFYLLFPLVIVLVRRTLPNQLRNVLLALAGVSLAAAIAVVARSRDAAFFFTPLRAWELLVGALISQPWLPRIRSAVGRNLASAAGLVMILYAALRFNERTIFPGYTALVPCIGAALVIAAGETGPSFVGRALSTRPLVFLGLISYSLYLIHWPLLVLQSTSALLFPSAGFTTFTRVAFLFFAIALASLSWALIETPLRKGRLRPDRRRLYLLVGGVSALLLLGAGLLVQQQGFPGRFPPAALRVLEAGDVDRGASLREGLCFITGKDTFAAFDQARCLGQQPGRESILLLGDSHAAELYEAMHAAFSERNILQANVSACPPWFAQPAGARADCRAMSEFIYGKFLPQNPKTHVVLVARWFPRDFNLLSETIRHLQAAGINPTVVGPSIEYDQPFPRLLAFAIKDKQPGRVEQHRLREEQQIDQQMVTLAATQWHVPYISFYKDLCTPACQSYAAPAVPMLIDTNHLTPAGAAYFVDKMKEQHELD